MKRVMMPNGKFSLTNQKGFVREEIAEAGRVYYVLQASQSVIIGKDMLTGEVKVFKSIENPNLFWL